MTDIPVNNIKKDISQRENLSYLALDYIKNMILTGVYREGQHLLEAEIADQLGISRGPVREGMKIAEQAGIITMEPRRGAYVTRFTPSDIQEVFEIRLLLENSILKDLITNNALTETDFAALTAIVDEMVAITKSTQTEGEERQNANSELEKKTLELNSKDIVFHQFIWKKSGSRRKMRILEDIFFQLRLSMLYDTRMTHDLALTATDHYKIIEKLKQKDIKGAQKALKDHIITC